NPPPPPPTKKPPNAKPPPPPNKKNPRPPTPARAPPEHPVNEYDQLPPWAVAERTPALCMHRRGARSGPLRSKSHRAIDRLGIWPILDPYLPVADVFLRAPIRDEKVPCITV